MPKTPVENRIKLVYEGTETRLREIPNDENGKIFLIRNLIPNYPGNVYTSVLGELKRRGLDISQVITEASIHPEWGVDPGVLQQY